MHVSTFLRVSTTVADLRRAEVFYRDALGFVPGDETAIADPAWTRLIGLPPTVGARTVRLRLGAQEIELAEFDPPGRSYPSSRAANDPWFQHIAIVVDDMAAAFDRLQRISAAPISTGGPQRLPANTGGVSAFKFRDPDGQPLELLQFPQGVGDAAWHRDGDPDPRGYDHSAIVVEDVARSIAFYTDLLGLRVVGRSLNQGVEQDRLDGLTGCLVDVVGLAPADAPTPHLELLGYRQPPGPASIPTIVANDVASRRQVLAVVDLDGLVGRLKAAGAAFVSPGIVPLESGVRAATLRDPDGHMITLIC